MSVLSTIEQQIGGQLSSIGTALSSSTTSGNVKSNLTTSQSTLQGLLDKLLLGQTLSAADQAALSASLDTSQKSVLAAKAQQTQWIIFGITGATIVGITIYILVRHHKKGAS